MEEIIKLMTNEELENLKARYANNQSVTTLIDGILATRTREEEQVKAKAKFVKVIESLIAKLPHPDDIMNIYFAWREVEVPVGEPEETEVVKPDGTKVKEMRTPVQKVMKWVVELNKGFQVKQGDGGSKVTTSKRAISVKHINGDRLEFVGNFPSASKACEKLGLVVGADSAMRVLTIRNPYVVEAYTGTEYTA